MTPCFLVVLVGRERVALRRYSRKLDDSGNTVSDQCPLMPGSWSYHNAETLIGEFQDGEWPDEHDHADPRWPKACGCGHQFADSDQWQVFKRDLYRRADGASGLVTLHDDLPGMMHFVPWYHDPGKPKGLGADLPATRANFPRGSVATSYLSSFYWHDWADKRPPLCVKCPNGRDWVVDAGSNNGAGWEVRGEAPLITCTPSIVVPGYHGFLGINGAPPGHFTGDVEGRGPMGSR